LKKFLKYFFIWLINLTWGGVQTALGLLLFIRFIGHKHEFYHGAILTRPHSGWDGGMSLGPFIFITTKATDRWIKDSEPHELGHTYQSMLLGPLYLLFVGLPSVIWSHFFKKRYQIDRFYYKNPDEFRAIIAKGKKNAYSDRYEKLYCEQWANVWGERATGLKISRRAEFFEEDYLKYINK
jgi:hypothetical protein